MLTLSNSLSLLRAPLAFLFLVESSAVRLTAIILAMITDSIDGFLARRYQNTSRFGAILDPAMDKLFVVFALSVFICEDRIALWEGLAMISRDFALCLFGIYLVASGHWQSYEFRAIRWGKVTTAAQFLILMSISIGWRPLEPIFAIFILFGGLALYELSQFKKGTVSPVR